MDIRYIPGESKIIPCATTQKGTAAKTNSAWKKRIVKQSQQHEVHESVTPT